MYMYRILSHDKICNVIEIPDSQQTIFIQVRFFFSFQIVFDWCINTFIIFEKMRWSCQLSEKWISWQYFFQAWVRCCALSECVDRDHEKCVTEKILQMPLLQNMIKFTSEDLFVMQNSEDPLVELIRLLGNVSYQYRATFFFIHWILLFAVIDMILLCIYIIGLNYRVQI